MKQQVKQKLYSPRERIRAGTEGNGFNVTIATQTYTPSSRVGNCNGTGGVCNPGQ
jgi:hypothetical protein